MSTSLVGLNIGGTIFTTSRSTLCSSTDTFFSALLSERLPSTKDAAGNYFIDRCGEYFKPILEYLRTGSFEVPKGMSWSSISREADFYQIQLPDEWSNDLGMDLLQKVSKAVHNKEEAVYQKYKDTVDQVVQHVLVSFQEQADKGLTRLQCSVFAHTPPWTRDILRCGILVKNKLANKGITVDVSDIFTNQENRAKIGFRVTWDFKKEEACKREIYGPTMSLKTPKTQ